MEFRLCKLCWILGLIELLRFVLSSPSRLDSNEANMVFRLPSWLGRNMLLYVSSIMTDRSFPLFYLVVFVMFEALP